MIPSSGSEAKSDIEITGEASHAPTPSKDDSSQQAKKKEDYKRHLEPLQEQGGRFLIITYHLRLIIQ
jgi:hypothetical protein